MRRQPSFETSADMRLMEHQRRELGIALPGAPGRQAEVEADAVDGAAVPEAGGGVVTLDSMAIPARKLIPGARVTLTFLARNDGGAPATGVRLRVPLPPELAVEPGTCTLDGDRTGDDVLEALTGPGFGLGTLRPEMHRLLKFRVNVKPGAQPIVVIPTLEAKNSAVVGARALKLERSTGSAAAAPSPPAAPSVLSKSPAEPKPARPFYELDEDEAVEHVALESALAPLPAPPQNTSFAQLIEPAIRVLDLTGQPHEVARMREELSRARGAATYGRGRRAATGKDADLSGDGAVALARELPEGSRPVETIKEADEARPDQPVARKVAPAVTIVELPAPGTRIADDAFIVRSPLDVTSLRFVQRLIEDSQRRGLISHFLFSHAFACTISREFAESLAKQNAALQRALLHRQVKKHAPLTDYYVPHTISWRSLKDQLGPVTSGDVAAPALRKSLFRILDARALESLAALTAPAAGGEFVRARRLTIRLFPAAIAGIAPPAQRRVESALAAYAEGFEEMLNRFMIRAKLDRSSKVFDAADPDLDRRARELLEALTAAAEG
jgi:uncharacterized repeat protein (TIGR01451 family)